jgi:hypothetical protein
MHTKAINVLKGTAARYLHDVTRFREQVTSREISAAKPDATPFSKMLLEKSRESLAGAEKSLAEIEASIRTLQAARPIHAVSASFAPGMVVKITNPYTFTGELATIRAVADDGILSLDIAGTVIAMKPSDVIYA